MEKRKPGYQLSHIKAAFGDSARLNRTFSSKQGASDFEKSMTSISDHKVWQDGYRPTTVDGRIVYVKFTLDEQKELLLISFKEA